MCCLGAHAILFVDSEQAPKGPKPMRILRRARRLHGGELASSAGQSTQRAIVLPVHSTWGFLLCAYRESSDAGSGNSTRPPARRSWRDALSLSKTAIFRRDRKSWRIALYLSKTVTSRRDRKA